MFVTSPGQTIGIKKIRHREQDALGIFFPYDTTDSQRIRIHQDRPYSATLQGGYLPYRKMQVDVLPMGDAAPGLSFSSLEKPGSGTIADAAAQNDHTGISSVAEEPSARALTGGKLKAADIQEENDELVHIAFLNRPFPVRMVMLSTAQVAAGVLFCKTGREKNRSYDTETKSNIRSCGALKPRNG
jgi:hypothetical protein